MTATDPALSMTTDDLRFVATIDKTLADRERAIADQQAHMIEDMMRKPCPGCAERCHQCGDAALD